MSVTLRRAAYSTNIKTASTSRARSSTATAHDRAVVRPAVHLGSLAHIVPGRSRPTGPSSRAGRRHPDQRPVPGRGPPERHHAHGSRVHRGGALRLRGDCAPRRRRGRDPGQHRGAERDRPGGTGHPAGAVREGRPGRPRPVRDDLPNFRGTREICDFRAQTAATAWGRADRGPRRQHGGAVAGQLPRRAAALHQVADPGAFARVPRRPLRRRLAHGRDGVADEPVRARGDGDDRAGPPVRRPHRLRRPAQVPDQRDVVADLFGRGVRAQVPDRPGHPGQRRLLPPIDIRSRPARSSTPSTRRGGAGWEMPCGSATCYSRPSHPSCPSAWWRIQRGRCAISRSEG